MEKLRYYQILLFFQRGEKIGEPFLLKHATQKEVQELLEEECIIHVDNTFFGDRQFAITDKGIEYRDRKIQ